MYVYFFAFFLIALVFFCLNFWRRKRIIRKVMAMCTNEKCRLLEELIEPFGFSYLERQDIFTSRLDAMQRKYGYCELYDETAHLLHMIYDSLPVYFDYNGRTWLIEFWKGQYGMNTGGEIGVYYADRVLDKKEYGTTLFQSVADEDMLSLSLRLYRNGEEIASLGKVHWWLTAFSLGCFSHVKNVSMRIGIKFPEATMTRAFVEGLVEAGYAEEEIDICCNMVAFSFQDTSAQYGFFRRLQRMFAQYMNHFWCNVYLFTTRPFCLSLDRVLYLYYYLPFVFRRMLRIRKYRKKWGRR